MDYLQWELERQRRALLALLGSREGGESLREETERRETADRGGSPPAKSAAAREGGGEAQAPAGRETAVRVARADRPGERVPDPEGDGRERDGEETPPERESGPEGRIPAGRRRTAGERTDLPPVLSRVPGPEAAMAASTDLTEDAGRARGGDGHAGGTGETALRAPAAGGRRERRLPVWAAEPGEDIRPFPGNGGGAAALRAEDGARALSRAVQRDARRYDGGFTIY